MSWFVSSLFSSSAQTTPQTPNDSPTSPKNTSSTTEVDSVNTLIAKTSALTLQDNNKVVSSEEKATEEKKLPQITLKEIRKHNDDDSCWIVLYGKVYDVTPFLYEHPGGSEILLQFAGARNMDEAEYEFELANHSTYAHDLLNQYVIGTYNP